MGTRAKTIDINNKEYYVIKELGRGSFGIVSTVVPEDKIFVVKEINLVASDRQAVEYEVRVMQKLQSSGCHPGFSCVLDKGISADGKTMYLLLEYIDGFELRELPQHYNDVERAKKLVPTFIQGITYLHHVHSKGFIHRDIKPANMMFTWKDELKIIDFGLACLYSHTSICRAGPNQVGTFAYNPLDPFLCYASDVYSFAISLFEVFVVSSLPANQQKLFNIAFLYKVPVQVTRNNTTNYEYRPKSAQEIEADENVVRQLWLQYCITYQIPRFYGFLLYQLIQPDYTKRPSTKECLLLIKEYDEYIQNNTNIPLQDLEDAVIASMSSFTYSDHTQLCDPNA